MIFHPNASPEKTPLECHSQIALQHHALHPLVHRIELGDRALEALLQLLRGLLGDDNLDAAKGLLGSDVAEDRLGRSSSSRSGRVVVQSKVRVAIIDFLDLGDSLDRFLSLNRGALDDRVIGLDLPDLLNLNRRAGAALAGEDLSVEGVGGTLGDLENGENLGVVEVEARAGEVVHVVERHVRRLLGDHGHAHLRVVLRGLLDHLGCSLLRSRSSGLRGLAESRVTAKLVKEGAEGLVAKQTLDEGARTSVLLHKSAILQPELGVLIGLAGDLALKLGNVFCEVVSGSVILQED